MRALCHTIALNFSTIKFPVSHHANMLSRHIRINRMIRSSPLQNFAPLSLFRATSRKIILQILHLGDFILIPYVMHFNTRKVRDRCDPNWKAVTRRVQMYCAKPKHTSHASPSNLILRLFIACTSVPHYILRALYPSLLHWALHLQLGDDVRNDTRTVFSIQPLLQHCRE